MILAINVNAAIDQVLFIDRFLSGKVMRPSKNVLSVGGKALDSAVVLRTLGAPLQAISFAAGKNGEILAGLLADRGIPSDLVWVVGETRVSYVIVETEANIHSHITTSGYTVSAEDCHRFLERVRKHAGDASWAILAGSIPGGMDAHFYRDLTSLLHQHGVKVLVDCAGAPAREVLPAAPDIFKLNLDEFASTFGAQADHPATRLETFRRFRQEQALPALVVTCGKDGMLAVLPDAVFHAAAPPMQEVNAAGSGDAVSATLVYRLSLGDTWEQALAWAAAASAAVVLTEGTAECRLEDVLAILPQTQVRRLS